MNDDDVKIIIAHRDRVKTALQKINAVFDKHFYQLIFIFRTTAWEIKTELKWTHDLRSDMRRRRNFQRRLRDSDSDCRTSLPRSQFLEGTTERRLFSIFVITVPQKVLTVFLPTILKDIVCSENNDLLLKCVGSLNASHYDIRWSEKLTSFP